MFFRARSAPKCFYWRNLVKMFFANTDSLLVCPQLQKVALVNRSDVYVDSHIFVHKFSHTNTIFGSVFHLSSLGFDNFWMKKKICRTANVYLAFLWILMIKYLFDGYKFVCYFFCFSGCTKLVKLLSETNFLFFASCVRCESVIYVFSRPCFAWHESPQILLKKKFWGKFVC